MELGTILRRKHFEEQAKKSMIWAIHIRQGIVYTLHGMTSALVAQETAFSPTWTFFIAAFSGLGVTLNFFANIVQTFLLQDLQGPTSSI